MPEFILSTTDRETATREQLMRAMEKLSGDSHMTRSMRWHRMLTQITGGIIQSYGQGGFRPTQLSAWRADLAMLIREMTREQEGHKAEQSNGRAQSSAANGRDAHAKDQRPQHRQRSQGAKSVAAAAGRAAKDESKRTVRARPKRTRQLRKPRVR